MNYSEIGFRSIGFLMIVIGIAVFLFKKSEGGARISIFSHEISVSSESLIIFIMGVGMFAAPEILGMRNETVNRIEPGSGNSQSAIVDNVDFSEGVKGAAGQTPKPVKSAETQESLIPERQPLVVSSTIATESATASDAESIRAQWFKAASEGDTDRMKQMLDSKLVTIKSEIDKDANTALHLAAERCDDEAVAFLLMQGANPLKKNGFNDSSLRIARVKCPAPSKTAEIIEASLH